MRPTIEIVLDFSEKEREWILSEIEYEIDSLRIDGGHGKITFDLKAFTEEDYHEYKIKMLGELYKKLGGVIA
jgi:hypothetical protein